MSDDRENAFWRSLARVIMPRRGPERWNAQRSAILEKTRPERSGARRTILWAALPAAAALAFAVWTVRRASDPPAPPVVARRTVPAPAPQPERTEAVVAEPVEDSAESETWDARVSAVEGEALLTDASGRNSLVEVGAPLQAGDKIDVSSGGRVEIALASDSVMEFAAGSRFTIGSVDKKDSLIDLAVGTVIAKLNWAKRRGYGMRIRTPAAVAAVRGTEFAVEVGEDGGTDIGVFDEGKVAVSDRSGDGAQERMITRRQEIRFDRSGERRAPPEIRELRRLDRHRDRIRHMNGRQAYLKEHWERMPPEQRREFRSRAFERARRDPAVRERIERRFRDRSEPGAPRGQGPRPGRKPERGASGERRGAAPGRSPRRSEQGRAADGPRQPAKNPEARPGGRQERAPQRRGGDSPDTRQRPRRGGQAPDIRQRPGSGRSPGSKPDRMGRPAPNRNTPDNRRRSQPRKGGGRRR